MATGSPQGDTTGQITNKDLVRTAMLRSYTVYTRYSIDEDNSLDIQSKRKAIIHTQGRRNRNKRLHRG